ncbi:MAG TPA: nuclear transport factor 2 family protein, partial [Thermoanaerobaculia bacterium]
MKHLVRGLLLFCFAMPVVAQDALFQEIAKADSELFAAFNAHDADKVVSYFDKDLEFFHDKGGLQNFDQVLSGTRSMFKQGTD